MKNTIILTFVALILTYVSANSATIYVDENAAGNNDGSSWTDSFISLQSALYNSNSGDQIWVAEGIYKPSYDYGMGIGNRGKHFRMINGVSVFGGFAGTETNLNQRDWNLNETILSADIGIIGDNSDNCYHVFFHPQGYQLDGTAVLDGFTLTEGNADLFAAPYKNVGGGICNLDNNNPKINNCKFIKNSSLTAGGAICNTKSSPEIINCQFIENSSHTGGGIYNLDCSPVITNCIFSNNSATGYGGGGVEDYRSNSLITYCSFNDNFAHAGGGGMCSFEGSSKLLNCDFTGNTTGNYGFGGGFWIVNDNSTVEIINSTFSDNIADRGGAIYNGYSYFVGVTTLTNCTITQNIALDGGGIYHFDTHLEVNNSIIWGNQSTNNSNEIYSINGIGSTTLNYCCYGNDPGDILGIFTESNCINSDPLLGPLADNGGQTLTHAPGTGSPCIDAGDNSYVMGFPEDQRGPGFPRIADRGCTDPDIVDIGAVEYQPVIDLQNSLVAYYPFDGNANDAGPYGFDGTVHGALPTTDRFGNSNKAYYFNGYYSEIDSDIDISLFNANATLSVWINTDLSKDQNGIFQKCGNSGFFRTRITQDGRVWIFPPWCGFYQTAAGVISPNTWHHLVITMDDSPNLKIYVDGALQLNLPMSCALNNCSFGYISIGRSHYHTWSSNEWFRGKMDDFRFYNKALNPDEICGLYNSQPPVALCKNVTVSADPGSCSAAYSSAVSIDNGSFDPAGNPIVVSQNPAGPYPVGTTQVTLTVTNEYNLSATCTGYVNVIDDQPPSISVTLDKDELWPPNHKLKTINATVTVSDNCTATGNITIRLLSVSSNEPDNGLGDGDKPNDIQNANYGTNDLSFDLRAERSGNGTGRTYTIVYEAEDASGNTATATAYVVVPHNQSKNGAYTSEENSSSTELILNCFPNPANTEVTFSIDAARSFDEVSISITDLQGNSVGSVMSGKFLDSGRHLIPYNISALPSGSYYYTIKSGSISKTKLLNIIR